MVLHFHSGFHAILVLATVDYQGYFTSVDIGLPGSVGDAAAWLRSDVKRACDAGVHITLSAGNRT